MQAALDYLMPYTQEWFVPTAVDTLAASQGVGVDVASLQAAWRASVSAVVSQATLQMPSSQGHVTRGKEGQHSEHLSYLLAEMQSVARAHPEGTW
jgi:ring-1,2-phenylacetyl-CoA epoxidase subunit PaaC